jgi:hypothetical protein
MRSARMKKVRTMTDLPNWTDRPGKPPFVGQRIIYACPGDPRKYRMPSYYYGNILSVEGESVTIELEKNTYKGLTFRFGRQDDGMWKRYESSSSHLRFKEAS